MTSKERVLGALNRTGYDRIPIKHEGTPGINHMIMEHFGLTNMELLLRVVGEDFRYVEPVYIGPELRTFADGHSEWWAWKDPRTIALMVKLDWGVHGDNLGIVQIKIKDWIFNVGCVARHCRNTHERLPKKQRC